MISLPLLVCASGRPGAGKSTLARRLADEDALWLPPVSCDPLRNGLRASGRPSAGAAPIEAFYGTIDSLLDRGSSLISDLSFRRGLDEAQLLTRAARCRPVNIHREAPIELARRRFFARQEVRPATRDARTVAEEMAADTFNWAIFEPLEIPIPHLIGDTSAGYAPDIAAIVAFCLDRREVIGG